MTKPRAADDDAPRAYVLWDDETDRPVSTVLKDVTECEDMAEGWPHRTTICEVRPVIALSEWALRVAEHLWEENEAIDGGGGNTLYDAGYDDAYDFARSVGQAMRAARDTPSGAGGE